MRFNLLLAIQRAPIQVRATIPGVEVVRNVTIIPELAVARKLRMVMTRQIGRQLGFLIFSFVLATAAWSQDYDHELDHRYDRPHEGAHAGPPVYDYLGPFESHGRGDPDEHGHAGHTSPDGYPYLHGIRTEIDFIERAFEFNLVHTNNADDGAVDELEFEAEVVYAFNNRTLFIVGTPLRSLNPISGPNTAGIGDLELGLQYLGFNGERSMLFGAVFMTVPTGDVDRDLGSGLTVIEPTILWLYDFGGGTYFQGRFNLGIPLDAALAANDFVYDSGLYHTFQSTENNRFFRYLTPALEFNGVTTLNGADSRQTILDVTTGVRWQRRDADEVGVGWSFPLTGRQGFENQLWLSYRVHF